MILVTPRLVGPMNCDQVPQAIAGRETRNPDDYELFLENILEAPRGQRKVWNGRCYNAAWKCDPTAAIFPCVGGRVHGRRERADGWRGLRRRLVRVTVRRAGGRPATVPAAASSRRPVGAAASEPRCRCPPSDLRWCRRFRAKRLSMDLAPAPHPIGSEPVATQAADANLESEPADSGRTMLETEPSRHNNSVVAMQRVAIVDPTESTRESLRTLLLGVDFVWLEAECARYEYFFDVIQPSLPDLAIVALDADKEKALQMIGQLSVEHPKLPDPDHQPRPPGVAPVAPEGGEVLPDPPGRPRGHARRPCAAALGEQRQQHRVGGRRVPSRTAARRRSSPSSARRGGVGTTTLAVNLAATLAADPAQRRRPASTST